MMRRMSALAAACCLLLSIAVGPVAATSATVVDCRAGGDLQAAIDGASAGASLTIAGTCVGHFVIDKDLTLIGRTPNATLDGGGSGTTLRIPRLEITVALQDLRITGGETGLHIGGDWASVTAIRTWIGANDGNGVTIWPFNDLTLRDSIVEGNGRNGVNVDGPISSLFMQSSTVRANGAYGIAASMQGVAMLEDSAVADNGARGLIVGNAGASLDHSTVSGNADGGIVAGDMAYVFVYSSTIVGNTTETLGGGLLVERADPASGGLVIEDTTIVNNTAGVSGGGLYLTKSDLNTAHAALTNVKFLNNRAGTSGGGLAVVGDGAVSLTDVTFHHNTPDDCLGC